MKARVAILATLAPILFGPAFALAQDIRGLEVCTAEKDMARRTGCLQTNVEFLQSELTKQARKAQADQVAASREMTALKADIVALKVTLGKIQDELAAMKKAGHKPDAKPPATAK